MEWKYELLWEKAKVQIQYAHTLNKKEALFPFWCALSFETFARSTLASVHPALLADPMEGDNILYVFGYSISKQPKSVPIKIVLERLTKIIEHFKKDEFEFCMNLMERRNRELHSGAAAFEDFPLSLWLGKYYRIVNMMLEFQRKDLNELLQSEDATMATKMIEEDIVSIEHKVKEKIKSHKNKFFKDFPNDALRKEQRDTSYMGFIFSRLRPYNEEKICPACKARAFVRGEISRVSEPTLVGEAIIREVYALPTEFECRSCGLKLDSYAQLDAAKMGGYMSKTESFSPMEYYDFDPSEYFEPDYGND